MSRTDPDLGQIQRPGKPQGPHYLVHQTEDCDHGVIPGVTVTPGDTHDPVTYLEPLERTHQNILPHPDRHGECSLRSFAGLRGTGEARHHLLRRAAALCRQNESGVQTVHICLRRGAGPIPLFQWEGAACGDLHRKRRRRRAEILGRSGRTAGAVPFRPNA